MARSRLDAPFFSFFTRYEEIPGTITASILAIKSDLAKVRGIMYHLFYDQLQRYYDESPWRSDE